MVTAKRKDSDDVKTTNDKTSAPRRKKYQKASVDLSGYGDVPKEVSDAIESIEKKFINKGIATDLITKILAFEAVIFRLSPKTMLRFCKELDDYISGKNIDINVIIDMVMVYDKYLRERAEIARNKYWALQSNQKKQKYLSQAIIDRYEKYDEIMKVARHNPRILDDIISEVSGIDDIKSTEFKTFRRGFYRYQKKRCSASPEIMQKAINEAIYSTFPVECEDGTFLLGEIEIKDR